MRRFFNGADLCFLFDMNKSRLPINTVLAVLMFVGMYGMVKCATAATYDDFNDGLLDVSKWEIRTDASPDVMVTETGGRLELSILPLANGETFDGGIDSIHSFTGDFDLQVDFSLVSWPNQNGVRSALGIFSDASDLGELHIERSASSQGDSFPERYIMNGPELRGSTSTSDQTGKLRLQRLGSSITGYSLDTITGWKAIPSFTNEELVPCLKSLFRSFNNLK